ncbi:MAG: glutamyl-tRNA reductase, partial [Gemmataceae bacterium]|nr:glutamyl-tRNA reductase [Gemmataceae bacterium]
MNLRAIGCNVASAAVEFREKLAFDDAKRARALAELAARYGAEAVVLGTCNRVELYLARPE